ncbi:DNA internalization-related competence protein ComEC/Rec2 [Marinobacter sp. chi1]|uniref:DNA internalization-related competence protein ComEC/Rec2 n=1 Tax=Marinobacter suaedae TaxID=3057675 RepID=A0ABT8W2P3_9GAMM|nr:DNA internalization-related competence protein ComEC/Rec2 [Marinobacter sp. chi1]MDO3722481.1 DNA internalization-related competence protein ComEC/Rec2 [Marinobacter sp. chi1]
MSGNSCRRGQAGTERYSAVLGVIAFSCGAIILYWQSELPPLAFVLAIFITAFCIVVRSGSRFVRHVAFALIGGCAGIGWALWHAEVRLEERLPTDMEGVPVSVSGYVCDVPSPGSFQSLKFSFCVTQWHQAGDIASNRVLPKTLRLAWYNADDRWMPDHRLHLTVVLKRPHGSLNPEGFRYENWLYRNGYRATGSVRALQVDLEVPCGLRCQYANLHGQMARWVQAEFAQARNASMVASLLVGYRGELEPEQWALLQSTGTIHLVAISGLHLGLVALGATLVAGGIVRRVPVSWLDETARRHWVFAIMAISCLCYALLAGFTVPTQRALIMALVVGWSLLVARTGGAWRPLVYALGAVIFLDPFAPLDQGFWLSFTAVAVLVWVFAGRLRQPGWFRTLLMAQCGVFAGLWPVLLLMGQSQPLAGALANLVAIPWVSFVVMPLLMAAGVLTAIFPALGLLFVPVLDLALDVFWDWLGFVSAFPFPATFRGALAVTLFAVMVLVALWVPSASMRLAAGLLAGVWLFRADPSTGNVFVSEPEVRVWDVGQGLSVLVRHQRDVLLYDTGPELPGVFSAVESVIEPNLRALGVSRINQLVVSHADTDHAGGLTRLSDTFEIDSVVSGEPGEARQRMASGVAVAPCRQVQTNVGELKVDFWQSSVGSEGNDASCVLRVRSVQLGVEWVLPGDISRETELEYLAHSAGTWQNSVYRVMIAPHHGSKTSSSRAWVAYIRPNVVVFSAGYRHRFGHPHPSVTRRYREFGAVPFSTACSGALTMSADKGRVNVLETWHDTPFWIGAEGQTREACKLP